MTRSISISGRCLVLVAAFAATCLLPASFAQAPQRLLTHHTREVVTAGRARRVGQDTLVGDGLQELADP